MGVTIEDNGSVRWGCNHCEWTGPQKGNGGCNREKLKAYVYRDRAGVVLFRKVRNLPGKTPRFWLQRPDGNGGWLKGTNGVDTRVIYRADEVARAIAGGHIIALVEGEKDADNLWRIGIAATCNAHGASEPGKASKWKSEHSAQLKSADIVVFNDNDAAGYEHAEATCKLSIGIARRVRRLDLARHWEAIPKGGDVSDWLEKGGGTEARLREMIEQASEYTKKEPKDDPPPPPPQQSDESEEILAELNRDNAVVLDAARTRVLRFEEVMHEASGERYSYRLPTFLRFQDFRDFYLNRYINVGDDKKSKKVPIGKWWLEHPDHRQYSGVVFVSAGEPVIDGRFNLWRGWGVEPKRGEWGHMREHMFEVLAARDDDFDRYTFNWLAWTVQHPAEQAEVALGFRGGLGTGKGTLGKAMCRIFGQHARHLSSPEHLTGRFNAHMRLCSFLFGDECYGPKDKSAEGTMKRLITEPTLQIEPKGRDVVEEPNRLHVMLASNHEWVVPAGAHERRYAVQDVAETHRQDPNWFGPIYQEMRWGGLEAMLYDLLDHSLGDWHPRQIVRTPALAKQQEESLSPLDQWWLELLQTALLEGASEEDPDRAISNRYEEEIEEDSSHSGIQDQRSGYSYSGKRTSTVWREGLYDQARRISPRLKGASDHAFGHYLTDQGCKNDWVHRRRGWRFPPLQECRDRWKERFPETVWRDQSTIDWTFGGD